MAIIFRGQEKLQARLEKLAKLDAVKEVIKHSTAELQSTMQRKADFKKGYQTGTTKRSVSMQIKDGGLTGEVKPRTEYSAYLEYGTRHMVAQPFVKPALDEVKPKLKQRLENALKK